MEAIKKQVQLNGIRPIMFDRFVSQDVQLRAEEKMYLNGDGKTLYLPGMNLITMLASNFHRCATKLKYGKNHGDYTQAIPGFVLINPDEIEFQRDNKPVKFKGFGKNGIDVDESRVIIKKSSSQFVPEIRVRPVLDVPWQLNFEVTLLPNDYVSEDDLYDLFSMGVLYIGIGTWRSRYGKSVIEQWQ